MNENVNVCITPKGDKPVLHFSQFDNKNVFTVTVLADDGVSAAVLTGLDIEFRIRKTDSHVVTIAPESVADNVITFKTTEQLCACCGQNIATVTLMKDDMVVSTLDILVDIQRDILSGGLTSESDIRNLTTQIEQIVPEVVGDDYYNKQEVDDLIDDIPTFDPTNYYNKSDVDGLLADKADSDDVYTKTETDNLLADKADKSDVYTKAQTDSLLFFKADKINDTSASDLPTDIVTLTNAGNDCPLSELTVAVASGSSSATIVSCGVNLWDEQMEQGAWSNSGTKASWAGAMRTVDKIHIKPNTDYYFKFSGTVALYVCWYDISGTFIERVVKTASQVLTTPANAYYCAFCTSNDYGTTYNNDIAILFPATQTNYAHYNGQKKTISFGTTLTQAGTLDVISGLLTLEDESTIQCTGVEIDTKTGLNNIFCDTGNILTLKYFGTNAEDLFRYIRLIKG